MRDGCTQKSHRLRRREGNGKGEDPWGPSSSTLLTLAKRLVAEAMERIPLGHAGRRSWASLEDGHPRQGRISSEGEVVPL